MLLSTPRRISISSLRECTRDYKVVLIPPWPQYRSLFISHFLASASEGLLYSRMPDEDTSLADWLAGLTREIQAIMPEFGQALAPLVNSQDAPARELGAALGADLDRIADEPLLLFIDEFDPRSWAAQTQTFIDALIAALGDKVKIILSSRMQSYQPVEHIVSSGVAVVLGVEWERGTLRFVLEERPRPQIEVYAFGKGRTLVNGAEIAQWEGMLPRMLFYYLIDHPLVTRDEIFADFWPKVSTKDATDIFHVTKHKVTEVLSRPQGGRPRELTQYTQGFYIPSEVYVRHYDVAEFEAAVERAEHAPTLEERELQSRTALELYRGPYLEEATARWAVERRAALARRHAEAQIVLGRVLAERQQPAEAAALFEEALKVLPLREDVLRSVIRCHVELGQIEDARRQLANLEDKAYRRMGVKPTPESQELRAMVASLDQS
jgi:DNA-binding SARP family transcriptional activator